MVPVALTPPGSATLARFVPRRGRLRRVELALASRQLGREVRLTVLLPPGYRLHLLRRYPLVLVHDGQDFDALDLERRLGRALAEQRVTPRIVVGIHADERRLREYGTSGQPDHAGRGDLADAHRRFVTRELLPFLDGKYRLRRDRRDRAIAGFSLGALGAFDVAWHHEQLFGELACFSASFWWRSTPFDPQRPDADRIAVDRIRRAHRAADLRYTFVVGSAEEESDRNGNGIVDVIDDTLDVIAALRDRGVSGAGLRYRLLEGGRHDQATWGPALVDWLADLPAR